MKQHSRSDSRIARLIFFTFFRRIAPAWSPFGSLWEGAGFCEAKDWGREKKKHSKYFWKILWGFPLYTHQSPLFHIGSHFFLLQFSFPSSCPYPFFHQIAFSKVRARKTFFKIFKNFFRPKLSFFAIFKTFSRPNADRVIPFHQIAFSKVRARKT